MHSVLAIHGLISGLGGVLLCGSCQQKDGLVCSELLRLTVTSRQRLPRHLSLRHKLTSVKQQPRISFFSRLLAKFSPWEKYSQSAFGLPGCAQFSHCLIILSSAEIYSRQVGVLNKIRFTYYYLLSENVFTAHRNGINLF